MSKDKLREEQRLMGMFCREYASNFTWAIQTAKKNEMRLFLERFLSEYKKLIQQKTVTRKEIENAVGDTSDEYTEGVVELFEEKGFEVEK